MVDPPARLASRGHFSVFFCQTLSLARASMGAQHEVGRRRPSAGASCGSASANLAIRGVVCFIRMLPGFHSLWKAPVAIGTGVAARPLGLPGGALDLSLNTGMD
jgi:hypothetical protein